MAIPISQHAGQLQELSEYNSDIFEYKGDNEKDIFLIKKYFDFMKNYSEDDYFIFSVTNQTLRKIKLLIIQKSDDYKIYEKILSKSKNVSYEEILINSFSSEISRSIDKEILKKVRDMK